MDKDINDIAKRIKLLGMSSDKVALAAGLARSTVRRWLYGETMPTLAKLRSVQTTLDRLEQERVDG